MSSTLSVPSFSPTFTSPLSSFNRTPPKTIPPTSYLCLLLSPLSLPLHNFYNYNYTSPSTMSTNPTSPSTASYTFNSSLNNFHDSHYSLNNVPQFSGLLLYLRANFLEKGVYGWMEGAGVFIFFLLATHKRLLAGLGPRLFHSNLVWNEYWISFGLLS